MTNIQQPLHIRQVSSDGTDSGSLCGARGGRVLKCFPYQVKHAVYSGADVCDECTRFYREHRDHFDNIAPPWNEDDERMAFGAD